MKGHKYNVAISGTHGKTTCTSMLSHITLAANLDPTILIGGELDAIDGNFRIGNSEYFLTEACEYKRSFLKFPPYVGIILNIDADHLDCYKDIDEIADTFLKFADLIPSDGYLVGYADDFRVKEILSKVHCNTLSYGFSNAADVTAKNIMFNKNGCATFDVYKGNENLFSLTLNVPGKHNILNALASTCVSLIFNITSESIIDGLSKCKGAHKRFEYKGELNGVTVIDDYAHHPTEIKATLSTAKQIDHNKTYCIFQPHTYTRTKALFDEFTECFNDVDELILMDIYAAREKNTGLVSSDELGDAIRKKGIKCTNVHSHDEALNYVESKLVSGDLLLTVGAGDVVIVGEKYLQS
jgi:UDP-N-acetylmuramate--alanine ligase